MNAKMIIAVSVAFALCVACDRQKRMDNAPGDGQYAGHALVGEWVRMGPMGPVAFSFKANGRVEGDVGKDKTIDVVAEYTMRGDTVRFRDIEHQSCAGWGVYRVYQTPYYLAFELIDDMCNGRIKTVMGYWTRPKHREFLASLGQKIASDPEPGLYRSRGRVYMAVGDTDRARADFDVYIVHDTTDARVYINRAGTRFPHDMEGAAQDCSRAIELDASNKNAWFLRGVARYEMGEEEAACSDFARAIALGFEILREAEQAKCADFWDP
jgi:hypothetical protein